MRTTASGLWRLRHCLYSERADVAWHSSPPGEDAQLGTAIHEACAHVAMGHGSAHASARRDEAVNTAAVHFESWWREYGPPKQVLHSIYSEQAFAFDLETGTARELDGSSREYADRKPSEVVGTVDLSYVDADMQERVVDIKTGDPANLQSAADSEQLAYFAMAIRDITGVDVIRVAYLHVAEDGVWVVSHAELDELDGAAFHRWLLDVQRDAPISEPVAGGHCKHCPALASCPGFSAAFSAGFPDIPTQAIVRTPSATMAAPAPTLGQLYELASVVQAALDAAKARVREAVESGERVEVAGGKILKMVQVKGRETASLKRATPDQLQQMREWGVAATGAPHWEIKRVNGGAT